MKLTAKEIQELDEITADMRAVDHGLEVALNYHANRSNELLTAKQDLWMRLGERLGFNPEDGFKIAKQDGAMTVVKIER